MERGPLVGVVTFAHFTCQPRCALKDGAKENQSFRALDVGVESAENGLFLANVTMPLRFLISSIAVQPSPGARSAVIPRSLRG